MPLPARRPRWRSGSPDRRSSSNDAHDAGGLRFEVVRPFEEHRVTYEGRVLRAGRPRRHGRPAARPSPRTPGCRCRVEQVHRGLAEPWGGEPEPEEGEAPAAVDPEKGFARGHFEQHMAVTGTVTIGDETFELHRRAGPARPQLGSPLLAGDLVVPLAHGQPRPRRRLRHHGLGRRGGAAAGCTASSTTAGYGPAAGCRSATSTSRPTTTTASSTRRCRPRSTPTTRGVRRSRARCGRASRCATGGTA